VESDIKRQQFSMNDVHLHPTGDFFSVKVPYLEEIQPPLNPKDNVAVYDDVDKSLFP